MACKYTNVKSYNSISRPIVVVSHIPIFCFCGRGARGDVRGKEGQGGKRSKGGRGARGEEGQGGKRG